MPNQKNRGNSDFSKYDRMSDEELEEILRLDLENTEGTESDDDLILYIMGVLADRDHTEPMKSAEEAFESFKENYYPLEEGSSQNREESVTVEHGPKKNRKKRWVHGSIVAAAMMALVLFTSVSASAFKFDLWGELVKWTEEVFHFGSNFQIHQEEPFEEDTEFNSLIEAMEKKKISTDVIPAWLPEEYRFYNLYIDENPKSITIHSEFKNPKEQIIKLQIKAYAEDYVQQIEKDNDLLEIYETHSNKYYIFENYELLYSCWTDNNCECYIFGEITIDELHKILDTIGG